MTEHEFTAALWRWQARDETTGGAWFFVSLPFEVADELGVRSIAFPLISAGAYGWPREDAVDAALETLRATPTQVEVARMVAFGEAVHELIAARL